MEIWIFGRFKLFLRVDIFLYIFVCGIIVDIYFMHFDDGFSTLEFSFFNDRWYQHGTLIYDYLHII